MLLAYKQMIPEPFFTPNKQKKKTQAKDKMSLDKCRRFYHDSLSRKGLMVCTMVQILIGCLVNDIFLA